MRPVLLVIPDISVRTTIESCLDRANLCSSINAIPRLDAAFRHLLHTNVDYIVVISDSFSTEEIASFLESIQRHRSGWEYCVLCVVSQQNRAKDWIVDHLILGVHGFLCPPFSPDGLERALQVALTVSKTNSQKRLEAVTQLGINEVLRKASGTGISLEVPDIKEVAGTSMRTYTKPVVDALARLEPSKRLKAESPFVRLREALEHKIRSKV